MVEFVKDKKTEMWIIQTTDSEGFHRNVYLTKEDVELLCKEVNTEFPYLFCR